MGIRPDGQKRLACIVADRGLLELRVKGGKTLRTLIYERKAPDGESRARAVLIKEAISLGYAVVDESKEGEQLSLGPNRAVGSSAPAELTPPGNDVRGAGCPRPGQVVARRSHPWASRQVLPTISLPSRCEPARRPAPAPDTPR